MILTYLLIAANAVISYRAYTAFRDNGKVDDYLFSPSLFARGRNRLGALLSHFSHADFWHFGFNMITLYYFGRIVEGLGGKISFILIYFVSGLGAALLTYYTKKDNVYYRSLGASGCISGILFAAIVYYPFMKISLLFIPIGVPAPAFAVIYILFSIFFMDSGDGISHEGHLGGAFAGLLLGGALAPQGYSLLGQELHRILGF